MKYRITIDKEKDNSPDERGYKSWDEIYQQEVDDVNIPELVTIINQPKP